MCPVELLGKLKQDKEPYVLREPGIYTKFRRKLALIYALIRFSDKEIANLEFPKQYKAILRRN